MSGQKCFAFCCTGIYSAKSFFGGCVHTLSYFCHLCFNISTFTRQEDAFVFQAVLIIRNKNPHQPVPTRVTRVRCCQVNVEESQHTTYT